ncbi:MAG TPA: hypothetical protein VD862_00945 [Candidatus Paceibacterota bacterium]|nr:hypothetical protein [Candidatus Paceibacterota bacterium]
MDHTDPYQKLARLLRTKPERLTKLAKDMTDLTGQAGVVEDIVRQNEIVLEQTLNGLGLARSDSAQAVQTGLVHRLVHLDQQLYNLIGRPNLSHMNEACEQLINTVRRVYTPAKGMFIRQDRAIELLGQYPPNNLLEHFGYANVRELIDKEGFAPVMASLRFTQPQQWMHQFFDIAYSRLTKDDFEDREVDLIILDKKWLDVAEKFLKKKYHNVSHLKEHGIIFIIPLSIDTPGETLRLFTLLLHYLHEVPYYSSLFRQYEDAPDFPEKVKSLLRGDVPSGPMPDGNHITWRVIQRYLAKDNADDFRLLEPHVSPEAEHWVHAEQDMSRLARILGKEDGWLDVGWWKGLDFVGDYFKDNQGREVLVSFDLIDLLMSLVQKERIKYLYHQQEALWNKIFVEYMGREKMEQLIAENIFSGFIRLK